MSIAALLTIVPIYEQFIAIWDMYNNIAGRSPAIIFALSQFFRRLKPVGGIWNKLRVQITSALCPPL